MSVHAESNEELRVLIARRLDELEAEQRQVARYQRRDGGGMSYSPLRAKALARRAAELDDAIAAWRTQLDALEGNAP